MSLQIWTLVVFFAFVMGAVVLAGSWLLRRLTPADQAAEEEWTPRMALAEAPLPFLQALLARVFRFMGESVASFNIGTGTLRRRLHAAGYRAPVAITIFHGMRFAFAVGLAGVVGWTTILLKGDLTQGWIPALCFGGFGYLLPDRMLATRTRARSARIRSGLPAALDLLVLAVEAGQALDQAMHDTARALQAIFPDVSAELIFCHLELRAGKSRCDVLRHLAERSPEPELSKLAGLLLDSDRFGTSLAPALRTHARYLRLRIRQQAQESARKLGVKLIFPVFFLIFPSVLLVTLGPAYLHLRENLGQLLGG